MKRLLDDYIFDDALRYEAHALWYKPADAEEVRLGGFMGAAVLAALLVDTDEGDARGIAIDGQTERNTFFDRYEREVRRDNGGLFLTEVDALSQSYIEFNDTDYLECICRNDRLLDLALGLLMDYMQRLVREEVRDHIYEANPWMMPFAQWLYNAAVIETQRQHLLAIDWTDAAAVYALADEMKSRITHNPSPVTDNLSPLFLFEGENAKELMGRYYDWLLRQIQAQADMMPDAKAELAELKAYALEQETDYAFLEPELSKLAPEHSKLFRKWMVEWTDFITQQIGGAPARRRTDIRQEFLLDDVLPCPEPNSYVQVRDYIRERAKYDKNFKKFADSQKRTDLCLQLSLMFGWTVDPNSLGKSMKRTPTHTRKKSLK